MKIDTHHTEWLSLMDVSGPFLSIPVLREVFPQGLDGIDADIFRILRDAYSEWQDNLQRPDFHLAWIRLVLHDVLEYDTTLIAERQALGDSYNVRVPGQYETLRPDMVLFDPSAGGGRGTPRLFIMHFPAEQRIDRKIAGASWTASPIGRMHELLRQAPIKRQNGRGVELGLVTNGEQWALVYAPRNESSCIATWYADIWMQERLSFQAFASLLRQRRLTGVDEQDALESLFHRSLENQQEVTDRLGAQVRRAVEVLVQTLDRIDHDRRGELLADVSDKEVYDAALTMMMRLVFLFSAEENGLLLLDDEVYQDSYSVSLLRGQLREEADKYTEDILSHRTDAWCRLLATFRAVYGGIRHEDLRLPAYGGRLFDPDRYPFLEGRAAGTSWRTDPAEPLPVDNRTVLHLLCALQELEVPGTRGMEATTRVLSFRGLDIEQIGHVYEGLLDHTAVRATEPVLGFGGKEPEIPLSRLEELKAKGADGLVKFLSEQTGRTPSAIKNALAKQDTRFEQQLLPACGGDEELARRVQPYLSLVREDTRGYPVIIPEGSLYVTQGSLRRSTGTHYTQRILTEPIVRHTLEPLVYTGPAEGLPEEEWKLKGPREILALRVCDMAMGSGAFLVQACRYLSDRLIEAWDDAEKSQPKEAVLTAPYAEPAQDAVAERVLPRREEVEERSVIARRLVAERCLYGVDINPMAVEMAKLSLWLTTMSKGKPFSFLDHALKCGDSLLGVSDKQLSTWSLDGSGKPLEHFIMSKAIDEAVDLRRRLEAIAGENIEAVEHKQAMHRDAELKLTRLKLAGDLILAPHLGLEKAADIARESEELAGRFVAFTPAGSIGEALTGTAGFLLAAEDKVLRDRAGKLLTYTNNDGETKRHKPFHWHLEFPEVFLHGDRRGFDAFVGNPPFQGGQKLTGTFGTPYREYLVNQLGGGMRGSADLCAYFFLRAYGLLAEEGMFGMLATNTIAQGDTRQVGLSQIAKAGGSIVRAYPSRKWPGTANLEVAEVWLRRGEWGGYYYLQDQEGSTSITGITPYLVPPGKVTGEPYRLKANAGKSFQGSIVLGMGFIMTPEEAQALIDKNPKNRDVLFPYLNGEDLNSRPDQSPSRWVINFFDWPLKRADVGVWDSMDDKARKKCLQEGIVPLDYPGPVAADYPDCLVIIKEKVKPERVKLKRKIRAKRWWQYAERAAGLYEAVSTHDLVPVIPVFSKHLMCDIQPTGIVFMNKLYVFSLDGHSAFQLLNNSHHEVWTRQHSGTLKLDFQYAPTDCFETFPFPESLDGLTDIGECYYAHRQSIMQERQEGLTKTYNRFHDPAEGSEDIVKLRELHVEMDLAVARAYGWSDLAMNHGFHETKQGLRYTISDDARREVLDRLLALNIRRYAGEVARGLHEEKKALPPEHIDELIERLDALGENELIQRVKQRQLPKGKSVKRKKDTKGKTGELF